MKKALIIINPSVGADATDRLREELDNHFPRAGIRYAIYETQPDDRTSETVHAHLRNGLDFVVAAGGDGTVAAACNGLADTRIPLGIVPLGTGNMVARELNLPGAISDAVALLAGAPRRRRIDALRINGRLFLLNASIGISAAIMGNTSRGEKQFFGPMAYIGTGIWRAPRYKPHRVRVTIDDRTRVVSALDVAVLNCGLLTHTIYPKGAEVRLDDGCLDVLILRVRGVLDFPRYFLDLILRRSATPLASYHRAKHRVIIRSTLPLAVQADGDIIGETPVTIEVLPAAITMLVPDPSPIPA
ncbi:MAG: diacylglycerol kinase family protein [bacterium]